jgi:hypothetical protein
MTVRAIHLPTNQTHSFTARAWDGLQPRDKAKYTRISDVAQGYQLPHFSAGNYGTDRPDSDWFELSSILQGLIDYCALNFVTIEKTFQSQEDLKQLKSV